MKVACIGNMNNSMFAVVRYLRDAGVDADLLMLNDEFKHFHPSSDTCGADAMTHTKRISWSNMPSVFYATKTRDIRSVLDGYDFIIGSGASPAYLNKAGKQIDLFIPYGADLYGIPFFKLRDARLSKVHKQLAIATNQRAGIRNARYVSLDITNHEFEKVLSGLRIRGQRLAVPCPFIYVPQYERDEFREYCVTSPHADRFRKIRSEHDIVVFHHSRHEWISAANKWTFKGNDKLIRGFAEFVASLRGAANPCLVMFEYGSDVEASKKLVAELGLDARVFWFPVLPRKDIMVGIHYSDIGAGEFQNSWFSYGTIYELMAMGKPIMHYREDKQYESLYPEMYPMLNARTAEEIAGALKAYAADPPKFRELGLSGRRWFLKHAIEKSLSEYLRVIATSPGRSN